MINLNKYNITIGWVTKNSVIYICLMEEPFSVFIREKAKENVENLFETIHFLEYQIKLNIFFFYEILLRSPFMKVKCLKYDKFNMYILKYFVLK